MWVQSPKAREWIKANPAVDTWLSRLGSDESRSTYGQCLQSFCLSAHKTPDDLLQMRREDRSGDEYRTLNLVQSFLLNGEVQDKRLGYQGRISKIKDLGKRRRRNFYVSIHSFFMHNRLPLPADPSFKIRESSHAPKVTYVPLDIARAIIGACRQPYKDLFTAALYGGMGRQELIMLNELWPDIKKQLVEGIDPIRIDFGGRKGSDKPFFTLVPARILRPYQDEDTPFLTNGKPIKQGDTERAWRGAKKRLKIKEKYAAHMLRDLFKTGLGFHCGLRQETTDFMTGHVARIDPNQYLQIQHEPDIVIEEWKKIRTYLDSGIDAKVQDKMLKMDHNMRYLTECRISEIERQMLELDADLQTPVELELTPADIERTKKDIADLEVELKNLKDSLIVKT